MPENTNIDDNISENPEIPESEQSNDAGIASIESVIITPQPEIENMETHAHHLHHAPGKKIWHYFYEFLMLFLAVFCGFLAENWREHYVERHREKEFINSIKTDLDDDIVQLDNQISLQKVSIEQLDSLITLLGNPIIKDSKTRQLYFFGRRASRSIYFTNNDRTIQQMKNSGGFRLIQNQAASNKIMDYYKLMSVIQEQTERVYLENEDYKRIAIKVFDPIIFRDMVVNEAIARLENDPPLLTYDQLTLKELAGTVQYLKGSRTTILSNIEILKEKAINLIEFLKKEYDID